MPDYNVIMESNPQNETGQMPDSNVIMESNHIMKQVKCLIVAVRLIGGGNRGKPPFCRKSLKDFIT
jgi:hypothetical protein